MKAIGTYRHYPFFSIDPTKHLLSVEDTVRCILHPQGHLCSKIPTTVNNNMFLVDTNALDDTWDIDSNDMGVEHNNLTIFSQIN